MEKELMATKLDGLKNLRSNLVLRVNQKRRVKKQGVA